MDIININNITCAEIESAVGFVFETLNHTLNGDCDQSWYTEDGRLLADPVNPHTLMAPALSVSSDGLVSSLCVNLNHEIICHSDGFRHETLFRVRNETAATPNSVRNETAATPNSDVLDEVTPSLQLSDPLWWILALFISVVLLLLMCFVLRKRIFSSRAVARIFQCNFSENRDPESGVQMKLRSDAPGSLNQSESEL